MFDGVAAAFHTELHCETVYYNVTQLIALSRSVLKCITASHGGFQRLCRGSVWLLTWSRLCPAGSAPGCRHWGTLCSGTVPPGGGSNTDNIRKQKTGSHDLSAKTTALQNQKADCIKSTSLWREMAGARSPPTFPCVYLVPPSGQNVNRTICCTAGIKRRVLSCKV